MIFSDKRRKRFKMNFITYAAFGFALLFALGVADDLETDEPVEIERSK